MLGRSNFLATFKMGDQLSLQERMDAAFDNYLALSKELQRDLLTLLDTESNSQYWRRNFVRVSASVIEGYAHCLRDMCAISFDCISPTINNKEADVLKAEQTFGANERIKLTLKVAYKLFELQPAPNFGGEEWPRAQRVLKKRHSLMHPKIPSDLEVSDELWEELYEDATWLLEQLFNFASLLEKKYGSQSSCT